MRHSKIENGITSTIFWFIPIRFFLNNYVKGAFLAEKIWHINHQHYMPQTGSTGVAIQREVSEQQLSLSIGGRSLAHLQALPAGEDRLFPHK